MALLFDDILEPVSSGSFDRFWKEWPARGRKVGKPQCLRKWIAKKLDNDPRIFPALERYKQSKKWAERKGHYIPGPHKWLNQEYYAVDLDTIEVENIRQYRSADLVVNISKTAR